MRDPKELQRWMTPDTSEPRVNRLWSRVRESGEQKTPMWRWVAGAALAATLAVGVFALWPRPLAVGMQLEASAGGAVGRFSDGSRVEVGTASSVRLVADTKGEVRVELERGEATFEVSKRPSRRFVVHADGVEVRVIGTRFTVSRGPKGVSVAVDRGVVEVARGSATVRLTAGQRWAEAEAQASAGGGLAPDADPEPELPLTEPEPDLPNVAPAPSPSPVAEAAPARPVRSSSKHHRSTPAARTPVAPPAPAPAAAPAAASPAVGGGGSDLALKPGAPTAAALFQEALAARREGRSAHAALTFDRFLRDFPHDSRNALAAFELGRL
ncbi:MAG: FecR domain-containing protein, partial [Myxococcaceae bacterium]|nr:FecR domain-containing protein [Myxococcaceae bacterium]